MGAHSRRAASLVMAATGPGKGLANSPVIELAQQLAGRAACPEILVVGFEGEDPPAVNGGSADPVRVTPLLAAQGIAAGDQLADRVALVAVEDVAQAPTGLAQVTMLTGTAMFTVGVWRSPAWLASTHPRLASGATFLGSWSHGVGAGSGVGIWEAPTHAHSHRHEPPQGFEVVAFVTVFNEEDILEPVLDDLAQQGVRAYVIDNWSTDASWDIVQERLGSAVVGAERWPADGPAKHFDLRASLARVTELTHTLEADWFIKHDADEIRRPPWPDVTLAQGLWMVQCAGYNVVDFTVMNHPPTDDEYRRGMDPRTHFRHVEFGRRPGHFKQFKAWRNLGQQLDYARYGSHVVSFDGVRVYPYKFELHHYPVRSQQHGMRKIMRERRKRYLPAAKARGWHTQYDDVTEATNFIRDPDELIEWDALTRDRFLIERLSGAGLPQDPVLLANASSRAQ